LRIKYGKVTQNWLIKVSGIQRFLGQVEKKMRLVLNGDYVVGKYRVVSASGGYHGVSIQV